MDYAAYNSARCISQSYPLRMQVNNEEAGTAKAGASQSSKISTFSDPESANSNVARETCVFDRTRVVRIAPRAHLDPSVRKLKHLNIQESRGPKGCQKSVRYTLDCRYPATMRKKKTTTRPSTTIFATQSNSLLIDSTVAATF